MIKPLSSDPSPPPRFWFRAKVFAFFSAVALAAIGGIAGVPWNNDAPEAKPDSFSTEPGKPVVVTKDESVLNNDNDPERTRLTAKHITLPKKGLLKNFQLDGTFTYIPNDDFREGSDTFTYQVFDSARFNKKSNKAEVTITITRDVILPGPRPSSQPAPLPDHYSVQRGKVLRIEPPDGVRRNDGDPASEAQVELVEDVTHGKLELAPDGGFLYTSDMRFTGVDSFNYRLNHRGQAGPSVKVSINVQEGPENPLLWGGIEIGSKGIKSIVLEQRGMIEIFDPVRRVPVKVPGDFAEIASNTADTGIGLVNTVNGNDFFAEEAVEETIESIDRFLVDMLEGGVPFHQIVIVGASSLPEVANITPFLNRIKNRFGVKPILLNVKDEVIYGILAVVPREDRGRSLFIDIGSGSTKSGYYEPPVPPQIERFVIFQSGLERFGTVSFASMVNQSLGPADQGDFEKFSAKAKELTRDRLIPMLQRMIERHPGFRNRTRVYLNGGIVWVMLTLLDPIRLELAEAAGEDYVALSVSDLEKFHDLLAQARAVPNPDLPADLDEETLRRLQKNIDRARGTFTREQLVAGLEILRGFADDRACQLGPGKELLFARYGFKGWLQAYVIEQAQQARVGRAT